MLFVPARTPARGWSTNTPVTFAHEAPRDHGRARACRMPQAPVIAAPAPRLTSAPTRRTTTLLRPLAAASSFLKARQAGPYEVLSHAIAGLSRPKQASVLSPPWATQATSFARPQGLDLAAPPVARSGGFTKPRLRPTRANTPRAYSLVQEPLGIKIKFSAVGRGIFPSTTLISPL